MFTVVTEHPVAVNSDDHKHPEGIYYDNNLNAGFVESVEDYFEDKNKKSINFMDLGCAGGALVCEMHKRGHISIGLEGSDHCLNIRPEMVEEVGMMPAGHENWKEYGNKILFTCDVTKPFEVQFNNNIFTFDLITCWDVIEHFLDEDLDVYFANVDKHLKAGGIFAASIHMRKSHRNKNSKNTPSDLNYHKSMHGREWWEQKLKEHFNLIPFPFLVSNRGHVPDHSEIFACTKK